MGFHVCSFHDFIFAPFVLPHSQHTDAHFIDIGSSMRRLWPSLATVGKQTTKGLTCNEFDNASSLSSSFTFCGDNEESGFSGDSCGAGDQNPTELTKSQK